MSYKKSRVDERNLTWFSQDDSKATLLRIEVKKGEIRGLKNLDLEFRYPITAIAGKNGSGKSTLLALAACANHNISKDFKPFGKRKNYYTFSDFFIQSEEEVPLEGIEIWYTFLHNKWRKTRNLPDGKGIAAQKRIKRKGGKWNPYQSRVKRNVIFLGIERVVPHSEKSVSKSYKAQFERSISHENWEQEIRDIVGRILGRTYDDFWYKYHRRYRLPVVTIKGTSYSGFNMGAGENALFEIFSAICAYPPGMLIIIDEIELGLHEEAQVRLIDELKKLCDRRHIQVICTTHSPRILECLPPEGRFFLERVGDETSVIPGISPIFATGKLSGKNQAELDVFVEDEVTSQLIQSALPNNLRQRINVQIIGSANAVVRQMAARYKENPRREVCAILDGDQESKKQSHINAFIKHLEVVRNQKEAENWISERLSFLPGNVWPERWILSLGREAFEKLVKEFGVSQAELENFIDEALRADRHDEFRVLAEKLNDKEELIRARFAKCAMEANPNHTENIQSHILQFLEK